MKIGIYPGTFDPITHGHADIITRSLRVFDKVVVAVAPNPAKHPLFNLAERLDMVTLVMKDVGQVEVTSFDGLLVDYVERSGAHANGANLRDIRLKSVSSLFSKETVLVVTGLIEDAKINIRGNIAMGPEADAQNFCLEAQKAVEKVNPTPERKLPSWLSGR